MAINIAKKLGFMEKKEVGQRFSYKEQLELKARKAKKRAEKYNKYADKAEEKAESLQAELREYAADDNIAFFTQPNVDREKVF
jgi:hypothetical protein